ncbi:thiolase family protein [Microbacterium sp. NPDC089695]|uniref:thiolase family protein n=1 Tax=Microbacterium sp. NPDC089695 TaxID=3364198 RepID=UPI00380B478B
MSRDHLAVIAGVGTSMFGKQSATAEELVDAAVREALEDAELEPADIDAVVIGTVFNYPGTTNRALRAAGLARPPITTVESACASGTLAVHLGVEAIATGRARTVLAVGMEKMSDTVRGPIPVDLTDPEAAFGMVLPGVYGMSARRYMSVHGVTPEELAFVSVKNHRNALQNPRAQYSGDYSVQEVLDSRVIADPLTLLQCSPVSDGAAAVVLTGGAGEGKPKILSSHVESGRPWPHGDDRVWNFDLIADTSRHALAQAGLRHADIDVIELHDAFTIGELVTLEGLGFFPEGTAGKATLEGRTLPGADLVVNPSGGLLSRGHPLGATGVAQVAEIAWQVTGRAGGRQLARADVGLVETMGGNVAGLSGNGCVVMAVGS